MAVPKCKVSKARRDKRRSSHWKLSVPGVVACPKCGKDIVLKKTKKGRKYYGCIGNPECDFMVWQKPSASVCPKCGSIMLEKGTKLVCYNEECGNVINRQEKEKEAVQ